MSYKISAPPVGRRKNQISLYLKPEVIQLLNEMSEYLECSRSHIVSELVMQLHKSGTWKEVPTQLDKN